MSDVLDAKAATAALAPVREALLARAHAEAEDRVRDAEEAARTGLTRARTEGRAAVETARREGEADAASALAADRSRARRRARSVVLRAQRSAYDALLDAVGTRVRTLADDPAWSVMREELVARARQVLGPDAVVREVPGGVVAEHGPRRAELTLSSLALAHLAALGPDVERLWRP